MKYFGLVLGILTVITLIRLPIIADYLAFTSDMGSYLMTKNWVLGDDPTGQKLAHFRPPLVGYLLVPFTSLFGALTGSKILAVISSTFIGIPFWLIVRKYVHPALAVALTVVFVFIPYYADYTAWGYLTLLGLAGLLLAYNGLILTLNQERWGRLILCVSMVGLAALNQTALAIFLIIAFVDLITSPRNKWFTIKTLIAGSILCLVWAPFYLLHVPLTHGLMLDAPLFSFQVSVYVWLYAIGIVTAIALAPHRSMWLLPVTIVIAVLGQLHSSDIVINNVMVRSVYVLPFLLVFAGGLAIEERIVKHWRSLYVVPAVVVCVCVLGLGAYWHVKFSEAADHLDMLNSENLAAVHWIGDNTPTDSVVFSHPMGLGYYVGALSPRAWSGSWWRLAPEEFRGEQAALNCTLGWSVDCDPYEFKTTFGYDFILWDSRTWQEIFGKKDHFMKGWAITTDLPWLTVEYQYQGVYVYQLASPD